MAAGCRGRCRHKCRPRQWCLLWWREPARNQQAQTKNCDWTSGGGKKKQKKSKKQKNKNERKNTLKKMKKQSLLLISPIVAVALSCVARPTCSLCTSLSVGACALSRRHRPHQRWRHGRLIGAKLVRSWRRGKQHNAPPPREANWLAMVRQSVASTLSCRPHR